MENKVECEHRYVRAEVANSGEMKAICIGCKSDVSSVKVSFYSPENLGRVESEKLLIEKKFIKYVDKAQAICQKYSVGRLGDDCVMTILEDYVKLKEAQLLEL